MEKRKEPVELRKATSKYLLDSDYLKVIMVAGYRSNLALTTSARVDIVTNTATISYAVIPWHDKLKRLCKTFTTYDEAHAYYTKLYHKFIN